MKKSLCVFSVVMAGALLCPLAACKKEASTYDPDIDLSNKPDLRVLMPYSGYDIATVNADPNAAVVEKVTGYKVNYEQLPTDATSTLNTLFMNRDSYNAIKLTSAQFASLVAEDALLDLSDAIEDFGPVIKEVISEESWGTVTVDGKIYGIPERSSSDNIQYPIVFRQDWMDELNLTMPETPEELKTVLQKFKDEKNVIPLTFDRFTPIVWSIAAGFGIYADWQEYEIDGKTKVCYYMETPNYKEYVDYMADLYDKGLIDQEVSTLESSQSQLKFTSEKAAAISTSIWSVSSLVKGLVTDPVLQNTTQENMFGYLRALKYNGVEHANRLGGCPYVTVVPFYMGAQAGYVIDWINSKLTDAEESHNFREIVLGEENTHFTYNSRTDEYNPVNEHFAEKDTASYYLTGSNEKVYTKYWLARVKKQPELERAWGLMMKNADTVGVYDALDFAPPLTDYASVRGTIETYAQDQFFVMLRTDKGTSKLADYLKKWNSDGGELASKEINKWFENK